MKNLKTMLAAIFFAAFIFSSNAQGVVIRGGVNFQNINGKDANGDKLENKLIPGFNVGIMAEAPIAPQFFFQPGLLFSTKGAKSEDEILGQTATSKVSLGYLDVPLNLLFKPLLGDGHLILAVGPYVGFGLTGNSTLEVGGDESDIDVKFQKSVDESDPIDVYYFKRFDAGANLSAGYEFANGLSFQLNTQLGLLDINPEYEGAVGDETKWNNTGFGLSLGYRFGG
ncbi:MAG: PorT family protein [Saprospiraceae bacterium]|nr:PorT family protein [Saprospiraceae bacterium]